MRFVVLFALITGVYTAITIIIIIRNQWIDFIDSHKEALNFIKNGFQD